MKVDGLKERWRTIAGWVSSAVGAVVLFVGWLGVSGEAIVAKQLPYLISGGLGGLALIGVGVGLLVAEDLRAERARIGRVEAELLEIKDLLRAQLATPPVASVPPPPPTPRARSAPAPRTSGRG